MRQRELERILELARWAPSGDNTQPWRFEITDDRTVIIHGHDTRDHCVYDLHGHASQLSLGALLETIIIAASGEHWKVDIRRDRDAADTKPRFELHFRPDQTIEVHRLLAEIPRRAVQRRWMSTRRLRRADKQALERAASPGYGIRWFESPLERFAAGRLMFRCGRIRYAIPEAFATHQGVIAWNTRQSMDRIPDQALGVSAMQLRVMRLAMKSWAHMQLANRLFAAGWTTPIQMDLLPAMACGAHFVIVAGRSPAGIDDYVDAGRAVQRVWLTATSLGLWQQPEMVPLIFSEYARSGTRFTRIAGKQDAAGDIDIKLRQMLGGDADRAVWMARIGGGESPDARAIRLPLEQLLTAPQASPTP